MFKVAYNPTDSPAVVDAEGRTIGGREWDAASDDAPEVQQALGAGQLVWVDPDGGSDPHPGFQAALAAVAERNGSSSPQTDDGEGDADETSGSRRSRTSKEQ